MYNKQICHLTDSDLVEIAFLIIEDGYSIRSVISKLDLKISKTSLWNILHKRINELDRELYEMLCDAFTDNYNQKALRGGLSKKHPKD